MKREISYLHAINEALDEALKEDPAVFLMGEDIGIYGGGFGATRGLERKYGRERVRSTPISESAITGVAVGAAMTGLRPVIELQFSDFITIAMDQLVNQAAKIHYMYDGKFSVPLVMRMAAGAGTGAAAQHSQSLENWMAHIPGLKVVQPATPSDAKGLLHAAIADNNPVIFYEHKLCYSMVEEVPAGKYVIPLGKAEVKASGTDVTVIATGVMVHRALAAAVQLRHQGISVEVVDPRTLVPLDEKTILNSVRKTKRVMIVTEAVKNSGFGAELAAIIAESEIGLTLLTPIKRLGGAFTPIPCAQELETKAIPQEGTIVTTIMEMFK